ncbi:MAG: hypothetical protein WCJ45_00310 [bacterium]
MRVFNQPLSREVASRFAKSPQLCVTGSLNTGLTQQIDAIQAQLILLTQKL